MAFDPEAFGKRMGEVVKAAVAERLKPLEARIAALEQARVKDLEDEVRRLRGTGA